MKLPVGFQFAGVACGIKKSGRSDVALITTDQPAVAAGVYTQNVVRAASIDWNRTITPSGAFRGLVINSGNANACTGKQGEEDNAAMAQAVASGIGADPRQVCVLSTGVIGHLLPMEKVSSGIAQSVSARAASMEAFEAASQAILTTDQGPKTAFHSLAIGGGEVRLAGMAKGAGMIGPNMATMLAVMLTDAQVAPELANRMLTDAANRSFNRISVEGHTSTNDALILVCSGGSGVTIENDADVAEFQSALNAACVDLAKRIPADGEGATHLMDVRVTGAASDADAELACRAIALSALVKTAITGADPNWGRIVSAAGYSGAAMELGATELRLNGHLVFERGQPVSFDANEVSTAMSESFETLIELTIGTGKGSSQHWTSDLTVDYVRFNSEYTT